MDGVIVEKDVARVTFDSEIREKKEAGLIESVVGNVFKTKVCKTSLLVNISLPGATHTP